VMQVNYYEVYEHFYNVQFNKTENIQCHDVIICQTVGKFLHRISSVFAFSESNFIFRCA
jgi:hypothetical protein